MGNSALSQEQLRCQIFRGLIASKRLLSEAVLRRKADIAGLKLEWNYRIFSVLVPNEGTSLALLVAAMRASFEDQNNIVVLVEGEIYCIAKEHGSRGGKTLSLNSLKRFFSDQATGAGVSLAVSRSHQGAAELAEAIEEVRQARQVGQRLWPNKSTYSADEMGIYIGIMPDSSKVFRQNVALKLVKPLLQDKILLQTVEMFLQASLNVTDAARRLKIHRNTLLYRLEKVRKITSFDVTRFEDALHVKLGLLIVLGQTIS